jgi:hypothetical protein
MVRLHKTTDKSCCWCDRLFDCRDVVIGIGLLCPRCVSDSLPGLASLFQAMLNFGGRHEWATAGDHPDAIDKMANTLAQATGLHAGLVAKYLDVRGDLYKHTGPHQHQADYVGSMYRLWLHISHVERSLDTVLAYPQPFGSKDPWNLSRVPLDAGEGARVERVFPQYPGVGIIISRHGAEWALVDWAGQRLWGATRTLKLAAEEPKQASPIKCAHALRVIRDRILAVPHHEEGYQFHCFPPDQAFGVFNGAPGALTSDQWLELYNTLVRSGIVQDREFDTLVDLDQLVGLADSYTELHRLKLLRPLPSPSKCANALRVFSRRVGKHAIMPEGTAWVSRVAIPMDKEGLVLATPELLVSEAQWTALLHLIDDRGIWVGVGGQGWEVDRDKLHALIDEFATSYEGEPVLPNHGVQPGDTVLVTDPEEPQWRGGRLTIANLSRVVHGRFWGTGWLVFDDSREDGTFISSAATEQGLGVDIDADRSLDDILADLERAWRAADDGDGDGTGPKPEEAVECQELLHRLHAMFAASEHYGPWPADILRARAMVGLAQAAGASHERRRKVAVYTEAQHREHLGGRAREYEYCEAFWGHLLDDLGDWHDKTDAEHIAVALREQLSLLTQCAPETTVDESLMPESLSTWLRKPLGSK